VATLVNKIIWGRGGGGGDQYVNLEFNFTENTWITQNLSLGTTKSTQVDIINSTYSMEIEYLISNGHSPANLANSSTRQKFAKFL
jgi:hypothetical protein